MRPTRRDRRLGEVDDVFNEPWIVAEYRPTEHGFDLALGWPAGGERQGAAVILTAALAEYLTDVERPRDVRLPIGRSSITRLRSALELRFDWDVWWAARSADLETMTLEAFARRHGCSTGAASQRRAALRH